MRIQIFYRKAILFFVFLFLFSLAGVAQQKLLYTVTTDAGSLVEQVDSTTMGPKLNIRIDPLLLASGSNDEIRIFLPNGSANGSLVVIKKTKQKASSTQFAWYGRIKDEPRSFVLLTQVKDVIAGHIRTKDNKIYRIAYIGNKIHQIRLIDQRFFKPDKVYPIGNFDPQINNQLLRETASCCDGSKIDVLVVYTSAAFGNAGGEAGINSQILESINITNESFINSNIPATVELVHSQLISFQETNSIIDAKDALQNSTDGRMDNIFAMRDRYHADIVVLLIEQSPGYDGLSNIMATVAPAFEANAFCVVKRSAAFSNLAFAHEIGHILGARHECNADNEMTPFPYSHGFSIEQYRTIMSENVSATRVEYWSDPAIKFAGTNFATGSMAGSCQSADANCLRTTIAVVSKFRCGQRCTTDEDTPRSNSLVESTPEGSQETSMAPEGTVTPEATTEINESTADINHNPPGPPAPSPRSNTWLYIGIAVIILFIFIFVLRKKRNG